MIDRVNAEPVSISSDESSISDEDKLDISNHRATPLTQLDIINELEAQEDLEKT